MSEDGAAARKTGSIRHWVDFGGLLCFALVFVFFRLRGLAGDEALINATWALVAGSAVGVAVGLRRLKYFGIASLRNYTKSNRTSRNLSQTIRSIDKYRHPF